MKPIHFASGNPSRRVLLSTIATLALSNFFAYGLDFFHPTPAAAESASEPVIYLNQAWSQEDREWYYHFSQGSAFLSYDIYLNLEVAGSQDLFRSGRQSERYGLLPQPANPRQSGWIADRHQQNDGCDARAKAGQPATMPA